MADTTPVYDEATGIVEELAPREARQKLRGGGAHQATPEEVARYRMERDFGGAGDQLLAGLAGAARGFTLGGSDVLLSELGGSDVRRALDAYRKLHPTTTLLGELGGSLYTPGIGALGRGAELVAGGGRVARELGAGRAMLAQGARFGFEGGAYGLGAAMTEEALGDGDYSAQRLVAGAGMGALLGGSLGAAIAGGGRLVRGGSDKLRGAMSRPSGEATERLVEQATGEAAAPGLGAQMGEVWAKGSGLLGVEGAGGLRTLGRLDDVGAQARRLGSNADDIITQQADRFAQHADRSEAALREIRELSGEAKLAQWQAKVQAAVPEEAVQAAWMQAGAASQRIEAMVAQGKGAFGYQEKLQYLAKRAEKVIDVIGRETDAAKAAHALDKFKRDAGDVIKAATKKAKRSEQLATVRELEDVYEGLRSTLENEALWGAEAAAMQRGINRGWTDLLDKARSDPRAAKFLEWIEGRFGRPEARVSKVNAQRVLSSPRAPENADAIRAWRERNAEGQKLVDAALEHMELSPQQRKLLEGYRASIAEQREALDLVEEAALRREQLAQLSGGGSAGGALIGGALGAAVSGDGEPGALAPLAAMGGLLMSPGRAVRGLAGLETIFGKAIAATSQSARRVGRAAVPIDRAAVWSAVRARPLIEKSIATVHTQAATPVEQTEADVRQRLARVAPVAPAMVDASAALAVRAAQYLAAHAPKPMVRPGVLAMEAMAPSDRELELYERRREVVAQPLSVLRHVEAGTLTPEAVEALRTVYPRVYDDVAAAYRAEVVRLGEQGLSPSREMASALSLLLDAPVEGIDSPETVAVLQASYAEDKAAREQAPPRRNGPRLASAFARENQMEVGVD